MSSCESQSCSTNPMRAMRRASATEGASGHAATRGIAGLERRMPHSTNGSGDETEDCSGSPLLPRRSLGAAARRLEPVHVQVVCEVEDREADEGDEVDEHVLGEKHQPCRTSDDEKSSARGIDRARCRNPGMHLARSRCVGRRAIPSSVWRTRCRAAGGALRVTGRDCCRVPGFPARVDDDPGAASVAVGCRRPTAQPGEVPD